MRDPVKQVCDLLRIMIFLQAMNLTFTALLLFR